MASAWDGQTKGKLWGYIFFVQIIRISGLRVAYFFSAIVSFFYALSLGTQRRALQELYIVGLRKSKFEAFFLTLSTFRNFAVALIDRVALQTKTSKSFTYNFHNESVLLEMSKQGKGGILISGHLGNYECAAHLLQSRVVSDFNVVMLDAEVKHVKGYLEKASGKPPFKIIPIKDDLSHIILINSALKNNEFIAIHGDRVWGNQKRFRMPFLNGYAHFPCGPFLLAERFKVPVVFVFAVKVGRKHFNLSSTEVLSNWTTADDLAKLYVSTLEELVKKYPHQWFNFFKYYVD